MVTKNTQVSQKKNVMVQKFTSYYIVYLGITPKIKTIFAALRTNLRYFTVSSSFLICFSRNCLAITIIWNRALKQVSTKGSWTDKTDMTNSSKIQQPLFIVESPRIWLTAFLKNKTKPSSGNSNNRFKATSLTITDNKWQQGMRP